VISRVSLQPGWIAWLFWTAAYRDSVRDGYFTVRGLTAATDVPVYFLDAEHNLGATAFLSGRSAADGPITVHLQPCGAARARLVDRAGKPVSQSRVTYASHMTMMVVSPGPHRLYFARRRVSHCRVGFAHRRGPPPPGGRWAKPTLQECLIDPRAEYKRRSNQSRSTGGRPRLRRPL
jgi:hypothetical protein